ncbi:dihydrofolate reductase family protein [Paenarthrobacter sp. PH39-S1]|uniref:dihydrofolate reductase family protein n=1 Tax=Paenarthrobacter sp. PH39-S1 TaxID=3046204 RepID=UPI0024BA12D6|nr:dihydrofolate reductase family protein [Paenarthrobacter sp. PH39-S1]MDJ0356681.1 dihydrofolate reductase family protein [Paenarthrobacter sp. PH39-S1]
MNRIIVIEFITLDGVVEDPDGSAGMPGGGWAFRYGPEAVAGDKFKLGERLENGCLLLGRRTWQQFSTIWPNRTDEFSTRMNNARKWVASTTLLETEAWNNSFVITEELTEAVIRMRAHQDVIVIGSTSIAHTLMQHGLVDEYRLLIFPTVLGSGRRLFDGSAPQVNLQLTSVQRSGAAALLRYQRADDGA